MNSEELTETVMEIVSHFQDALNAAGFSIVFDQSLLRQAEGCLQLLDLCEGDVLQAKALIALYCEELWWAHNHPELSMVARRAEHLQQQMGHDASYLPQSWEEERGDWCQCEGEVELVDAKEGTVRGRPTLVGRCAFCGRRVGKSFVNGGRAR